MTDEELREARKLCEAATPGPWRPVAGRTGVVSAHDDWWVCSVNRITPVLDVEFIAAARTLVPRLLAEVERLDRSETQLIEERDFRETQINDIADALGDESEWSSCNDRAENAHTRAQAMAVEVERLRADNAALTARRDELLATIARISQSEPLPDEVQHALSRQGALLAEVGTLRARIAELEGERAIAAAIVRAARELRVDDEIEAMAGGGILVGDERLRSRLLALYAAVDGDAAQPLHVPGVHTPDCDSTTCRGACCGGAP
jgi:hypothetical protein